MSTSITMHQVVKIEVETKPAGDRDYHFSNLVIWTRDDDGRLDKMELNLFHTSPMPVQVGPEVLIHKTGKTDEISS
jgi:hypothetical protein